jgi:hypothetical protein
MISPPSPDFCARPCAHTQLPLPICVRPGLKLANAALPQHPGSLPSPEITNHPSYLLFHRRPPPEPRFCAASFFFFSTHHWHLVHSALTPLAYTACRSLSNPFFEEKISGCVSRYHYLGVITDFPPPVHAVPPHARAPPHAGLTESQMPGFL